MSFNGPKSGDHVLGSGAEDIQRLVRCLQSILDGQSAVEELIQCGPEAIAHLREFLLSGRITSVFQPRMWAVEALTGLGAREVLVEYLQSPKRTSDPQLSFAEDAVLNTAARALRAWRDPETLQVLLNLCRQRNLPGVIETLAEFDAPDAIPCLDRALEDGLCRIAAENGLRKLGAAAKRALLLSAVTPLPSVEEETPSSVSRRRSVLMLLTEIGVDASDWKELRRLLTEHDPELLVRTARIASAAAETGSRSEAAAALVKMLPSVPWHVTKEAEQALLALAPESLAPIRAELDRRSSESPLVRAADEVLRMLLRVAAKLRGRHAG